MQDLRPDDIYWAFQYYLGRYPESPEVVARHLRLAGGVRENLCRVLLSSSEGSANKVSTVRSANGAFFHWRGRGPKICVLGNCQAPNIARAISQCCGEAMSVAGIEIMDVGENNPAVNALIASCDVILACKVYDRRFLPLSAESIRRHFGKTVVEYAPIHFAGVHTDMTVLGESGARIASPLGDYHSRLILSAFLAGRTEGACRELFCGDAFRHAGYYDVFAASETEALRREGALDGEHIAIAEWFMEEIRRVPLLLTMNHPTSRVFAAYAERFLAKMGLGVVRTPVDLLPQTLLSDTVWPVFPEIAAAHHLAYATQRVFWKNATCLDLEEFIWRSYRAYASLDGIDLRGAAAGRLVELAG